MLLELGDRQRLNNITGGKAVEKTMTMTITVKKIL
jgi:hypothetical protein